MKLGITTISKVRNPFAAFKRFWVVSLLTLVLLASSWALLRPGFFRAHDYVHAARIAEMTRSLQDGHFPVRWSQNFGFGYGMPLFEFYAPLPFYVGSLFYWLGMNEVTAVKLLFLLANLGTLLGGYFLGKTLFGKTGGIITAAALVLSPYRAVNLFVRGAVSEAWGIMFLPWILWGIVILINQSSDSKTRQTGWIVLVSALVGLMLSHNLTTMMFLPLSVVFGGVYLVWQWHQQNNYSFLTAFFRLVSSYVLAVGMASFYLFPALVENKFTKIDSILGGYFHYSQHFLYIRQFFLPNWGYGGSEWGPNDGISFFLGFGQLLGLFITTLLFTKMLVRKKWQLASTLFITLGVLLGFSLFMSLFKSEWIWNAIPFLSYIQFPWRWLAPAIMLIALLVGLSVRFIANKAIRLIYAWVLVLFLIISNVFYFQPESFLDDPNSLYYTDESRIQLQMSQILPDYIPVQMSESLTPPTGLVSDQLAAIVLAEKTHQKLIGVKLTQPELITFAVADFPGWQVEVDGQAAPSAKAVNSAGMIQVAVPAGEHTVGLNFGSTPVRQVSDLISLISLVIFGFFALKTTHENA